MGWDRYAIARQALTLSHEFLGGQPSPRRITEKSLVENCRWEGIGVAVTRNTDVSDEARNRMPILSIEYGRGTPSAVAGWSLPFRAEEAGSTFVAPVAPIVAQPKLSILMASHNEQNTITKTARTLLKMRYPCDTELIVVRDDSTGRNLSPTDSACRMRTTFSVLVVSQDSEETTSTATG